METFDIQLLESKLRIEPLENGLYGVGQISPLLAEGIDQGIYACEIMK